MFLQQISFYYNRFYNKSSLGKPQKKQVIFLMAVPLREGGGVKGLPLRRKKISFRILKNWLNKFRLPLSSRGGGVKALMALPIR